MFLVTTNSGRKYYCNSVEEEGNKVVMKGALDVESLNANSGEKIALKYCKLHLTGEIADIEISPTLIETKRELPEVKSLFTFYMSMEKEATKKALGKLVYKEIRNMLED